MKILLVIDCNTSLINGVALSVKNLEKGLLALGHDVRILMPSNDGKAVIEGNHYLLTSSDCDATYPGLRLSNHIPKIMRTAIYKWKPDIIHSNSEGMIFFSACRIAKKTGAKHVHSFHTNYLDYYYIYSPIGKRLTLPLMVLYGKLFYRRLDGYISPSQWGKDNLERFHFPDPYYVIPNGISMQEFLRDDMSERMRIRESLGVNPNEILLIFAGRVAEEKNLPKLLELFDKIKNPLYKLMIVGDGPVLQQLKDYAGKLESGDRIIFTGMIPTEKISGYYAAADVFVTASLSEVQPLTYVEAMASGIPVVCAFAPFVKNLVINKKTGYTFCNSEEFLEYVQEISEDSNLRRRMGDNARQCVLSEYSIETFSNRISDFYFEVIRRKNDNQNR